MQTNNAIIVQLQNVRPHPNADRLKLATVVGDQVVVGLDAKDGDVMVYFDCNLRLSHYYLHRNNLYQNESLNADPSVRGYFGKNGRVRAQKFRGSMSNGFVAARTTLDGDVSTWPTLGDEFTQIDGEMICEKYVIPVTHKHARAGVKKTRLPASKMFWKHWNTKHLLRDCYKIPTGVVYLEEKIHGTSGRTGKALCPVNKPWWKRWGPDEEWRIVSGTRRVDNMDFHLAEIRKEIDAKLAPHLRKGEQVYYEIFGNTKAGVPIQPHASYGCQQGKYRVVPYRVTITTADCHCYDLGREAVYLRAAQLGLEAPPLLGTAIWDKHREVLTQLVQCMAANDKLWSFPQDTMTLEELKATVAGKSTLDPDTLLEGVVVWFEDAEGKWDCLKLKSDEFLLQEDKLRGDGIPDPEDMIVLDPEDAE